MTDSQNNVERKAMIQKGFDTVASVWVRPTWM